MVVVLFLVELRGQVGDEGENREWQGLDELCDKDGTSKQTTSGVESEGWCKIHAHRNKKIKQKKECELESAENNNRSTEKKQKQTKKYKTTKQQQKNIGGDGKGGEGEV